MLPFHSPLLRFFNKKLTFLSCLRLQRGRLVLSLVSKILRSKSRPRSWSRKSRGQKSHPRPRSQKITGGKPRPRHRSRKMFGKSLNARLDLEVVTMSGLVLGLSLEKVVLADLCCGKCLSAAYWPALASLSSSSFQQYLFKP